mmetsp:Transcript_26781/g.65122  ORF Transcript_26781/g.65122 Transcript_26781/m.65122 type:complete len:969 (+) Transcript_26781:574-3480(+)|eukprot:CAMPEP_0113608768 /NCGR_PEP_ID=MMETSP0017_2-20120614/4107_1 /TAXON_ID=2856 /ORGANISM="Cylindrotheca closterium" /LENGTH=968 /DNA_ID=CAMNT_0000517487 /DNA_START=434 /DNA_END=3340 /DNA_ORIENTATION=+ /assembly_acc=CAM_ASM_000147
MKWNCNGITKTLLTVGIYTWFHTTPVHGAGYNNQTIDMALSSAEVDKPFLTEPCLAVVEEFDYEPTDDDNVTSDTDESWLYCETPGGYFYKVPTTDPTWIEAMVQGGKLISGVTELDLPPDTLVNERLGILEWNTDSNNNDTIVAPGLVQVDEYNDDGATMNHTHFHRRQRRLARVTGTKTVLAVRVIASDQPTTFDEATLRNEVFGTGNTNLKTQFEKCSIRQLIFVPTNNRQGKTVSIVGGVVTVTVNRLTTEGDSVLRNAVTTKLKQEFGVSSPSQLADHVMYCLPSRAMVGIAYAYINSWLSVYKDVWGLYVSAQMHELGHNLNLAHATDFKFLSHDRARNEYDDKTGLMGYSYNHKEFPKMCFNPAKSWQLKWYSNKEVTYTPTCSEVTMKVGSIIDYEANQVQTVLLQISQSSLSSDYYMTYNARTLFNRETQEGGNKLVIDAQGGNGRTFSKSTLEARLEVGESFEMKNFNGVSGDKVVVHFSERGGFSSREATVTIVWIPKKASVCATNTPTKVPSEYPTRLPSRSPTRIPSAMPTGGSTASPTMRPSALPSFRPTPKPTQVPSEQPTFRPTIAASVHPTKDLSGNPSGMPTETPSDSPTTKPSILASDNPTIDPTMGPTTLSPTSGPTMEPTEEPTRLPSPSPTPSPTSTPSNSPSVSPTSNHPSIGPTFNPTFLPTAKPSSKPSLVPTPMPSLTMSGNPTIRPSRVPSSNPTTSPSLLPTTVASDNPTTDPTERPTKRPTNNPTLTPTIMPSNIPSLNPTSTPTEAVSNVPTREPTTPPTVAPPSEDPTEDPTSKPTLIESDAPTKEPTGRPTIAPSKSPTPIPTITWSDNPTMNPTARPTAMPSKRPTPPPTAAPSNFPTPFPTPRPTAVPSRDPTISPSLTPSKTPTPLPTSKPSLNPSLEPTLPPTMTPSINPSDTPTTVQPVQPRVVRPQTPVTNPECRRWYWFLIVDCKSQGI